MATPIVSLGESNSEYQARSFSSPLNSIVVEGSMLYWLRTGLRNQTVKTWNSGLFLFDCMTLGELFNLSRLEAPIRVDFVLSPLCPYPLGRRFPIAGCQ
jgi:hypothetical protein